MSIVPRAPRFCADQLKLRHLAVFCTVARLGNMSRAAELLGVSQSWVSRVVDLMERQLETSLTVRTGAGVRMTEAGQTIAQYGERILRLAEQMSERSTGVPDRGTRSSLQETACGGDGGSPRSQRP
ncbi:MAG: LysR family transcriptional regulator [Dehalococcoidia bacterium]